MKQTIEQHQAGLTALAAAAVVARRRFHTVTANGYAGIGNANWPATKPMHVTTTCHRPRGASPQT